MCLLLGNHSPQTQQGSYSQSRSLRPNSHTSTEGTMQEPCSPESSCCSSKYQHISGLLSCYIYQYVKPLCCSYKAPVGAIHSSQLCSCFQEVFQARDASSLPNRVVSLNALDMHLTGVAPNRFQEVSQSQGWELRKVSVTKPRPPAHCQQSAWQ